MAAPLEECIFCGKMHRGLCADDKPKPAPKKRAPKTAPPSTQPPELLDHVVKSDTAGPGVTAGPDPWEPPANRALDRWAGVAANHLTDEQVALQALASIMHPNELEKHGLRRPTRPQLTAKVTAWKEKTWLARTPRPPRT